MIYQRLKPFNDINENINTVVVKYEIDQALKIKPNCLPQVVEDLIFLAIDYKVDNEIVDAFAEGFNYLFDKGLKWKDLKNIDIGNRKNDDKKIPFLKLHIFNFKTLIIPAFEKHFLSEFIQNTQELKSIAFKMFSASICSNEKLLKIGERLDIINNQEYLTELMFATKTFPQMHQLSKVFNIEPWSVITKKSGIETLWPVNIWHMENAYLHDRQKTSFEKRKEFFLSGKNVLQNIKTEKTSNLDFQSRFVFVSCNIANEHNYSELLRDLGIKNINLNCIDHNLHGDEQILKDRLLQFGKIRLINKFEKKNNVEVNLGQVITSVPNKSYLISNKKAFLKQYLNNLDDEINYTGLLEAVLETKNRKYANSLYEIKCYLPLKKEFLNAPKSYWADIKVNSSHFIDINEYNTGNNISAKSFYNLLHWYSDKDVDWTKIRASGNYVITDTVILAMQLENEPCINELSSPNGLLGTTYKNLSHIEKKEVLYQIKNNWDKIWDFSNSTKHQFNILNTPYKKPSNVFNFMHNFIDNCLHDNVKIEPIFFDGLWDKLKEDIKPYAEHDEAVQKLLVLSNTLELNSTLEVSEQKKSNKSIKI